MDLHRLPLIVVSLLIATVVAAGANDQEPPRVAGDYLNEVKPRLVTPHLPYTKPLVGGPVRAR